MLAVVVAALTSCSPRLVGTWNVQRYETTKPGQPGVALSNIGTVQFYNSGNGEKNVNYTLLGVTMHDQSSFKWHSADGKYVTIEGKDSVFTKTWIIMKDKKNYQKWKSTDGSNNIQILELVR